MAQGSFTDFDKIRPGAYVRLWQLGQMLICWVLMGL